jgi:hypothetical protein
MGGRAELIADRRYGSSKRRGAEEILQRVRLPDITIESDCALKARRDSNGVF